jgi:putative membrane protein insertion efficiency factor
MAGSSLRAVPGALMIVCATVAGQGARPVALAAIHFYQQHVSDLAATTGHRCRFTPTCSRYAETVIARDGVMRGGWRSITRIARCGPWTTPGTRDEP